MTARLTVRRVAAQAGVSNRQELWSFPDHAIPTQSC